jgi:3-methylcrotonyl-CoA carboxylase alpha subunit
VTTIKKILIANRGEIACRIIKTCRKMGIATVAVYSDADADALHVEMADEAQHIGAAAARESYLDMSKIIAAAKVSGADAIHPGYGFLSENEDFAEACEKANIIFIGPPASAIRAMGGKSEAKALMEKAKVPLVPGYHGDNQDVAFLVKEAAKIGYPVLIKASAGGGGKGMRAVEDPEDFIEQLTGAKREAKAAFGDDHVLIEKYLVSPRHVEIQVFADKHGNTVYLFERDCSIQRRHQKVIEEAPAPGLSQSTREKMGAAAVAAAKAIGYVGAGTVEFLLDAKENFYFMEMNTRLQVEHPVTELITGLDLVALQIAAAEGKKLDFTQKDLFINGHSIEVRLYAEDPSNNFLPGAGQIRYLRFPLESNAVRVDAGVREAPYGDGDVISIHYDPMIAKIIVWGKDRDTAIEHLRQALDETLVAGPKTNLNFLRQLAAHPEFKAGKVSTHFIKQHESALLPPKKTPDATTLALATIGLLKQREDTDMPAHDWTSPWNDTSGWRVGGAEPETFSFGEAGDVFVAAGKSHAHPEILAGGRRLQAYFEPSAHDAGFVVKLDGRQYHAVLLRDGRNLTLLRNGHMDEITYHDPLSFVSEDEGGSGKLTAPMPGKVVAVRVQLGEKVSKGQPLVVVEAMKMEHTITAPVDGVVGAINANVGDQVDERLELIAFK